MITTYSLTCAVAGIFTLPYLRQPLVLLHFILLIALCLRELVQFIDVSECCLFVSIIIYSFTRLSHSHFFLLLPVYILGFSFTHIYDSVPLHLQYITACLILTITACHSQPRYILSSQLLFAYNALALYQHDHHDIATVQWAQLACITFSALVLGHASNASTNPAHECRPELSSLDPFASPTSPHC